MDDKVENSFATQSIVVVDPDAVWQTRLNGKLKDEGIEHERIETCAVLPPPELLNDKLLVFGPTFCAENFSRTASPNPGLPNGLLVCDSKDLAGPHLDQLQIVDSRALHFVSLVTMLRTLMTALEVEQLEAKSASTLALAAMTVVTLKPDLIIESIYPIQSTVFPVGPWQIGQPAESLAGVIDLSPAELMLFLSTAISAGEVLELTTRNHRFEEVSLRALLRLDRESDRLERIVLTVHEAPPPGSSYWDPRDERDSSSSSSDLIIGLAHDLRTPLQRMLAISSDARTYPELSEIALHADDLLDLVESFVLFAQYDLATMPVEEIELRHCLERAVRASTAELTQSQGIVSIDSLPRVLGNSGLMVQVFRNLVSNACKHSGAVPLRISIGAEIASGEAIIKVSDNGRGIPTALRDQVFRPHFRYPKERSLPGSGMGLALCRRYLHAQGGRIWLGDTPDSGISVQFALPCSRLESSGNGTEELGAS